MKAALIGLGRMGRRHLENMRSLGLEVVGAADPRSSSATSAIQDGALATDVVFPTAEALFARVKPEVVVIAATAPAHASATKLAARAGARYVLCEKPMASSLAECDQMISECERSGTLLAINHPQRVMEQYTALRNLVEAPEFGGVSSITVVGGNFGVAMNGTHYFEMLRWLTSEPPHQVSAWFSSEQVPNPRGPEFSDRGGSVRVITKSGRRLNLECGPEQGHGIRVVYAGRYGLAVSDELGGTISVSTRKAEDRELPTTRYGTTANSRVLNVAPADALVPSRRVLESLMAGRDFPSGQEGRLAVATLVAAFVSNESEGRSIPVDGSLPLERRFDYA
ncbi:MAG: Gfo/Idh/MocA family protein [Polyangiaceae bacterium]